MRVVKTLSELQTARRPLPGRVAFVPTMGNLHAGHLSLIELAQQHADHVVVSIFVNPLQFSAGEDLASYPRTLQADLEQLQRHQVDVVFTPDESELYADSKAKQTQVFVPELSTRWCGASRPNFFGGIATVVTKLFQLVKPDVAIFGQKDYQQYLIIEQLVRDLHFDIELVMAPIAREHDGLAMSSRNGYLSTQERQIAPELHRSLQRLAATVLAGERAFLALVEKEITHLKQWFAVDYLAICRASDLQLAEPNDVDLVVLAAVMLGKTRLIDNLRVHL